MYIVHILLAGFSLSNFSHQIDRYTKTLAKIEENLRKSSISLAYKPNTPWHIKNRIIQDILP